VHPVSNVLVYTVIAGGGSVGLVYFVPESWRSLGIIGLMTTTALLVVQEVLSDGTNGSFSFQVSPTRASSGGSAEVGSDGGSVYYYALGVLSFGTIALFFVI
jgi:hypothetical protein